MNRKPQQLQQTYLTSNVNLSRVVSEKISDKLNRRYMITLGSIYYPGLKEFVASSRARRIQAFYKERFAEKCLAVQVIQKRWRRHRKCHEKMLLHLAKLQHQRRRSAINRIYELHRLIKVRKVTASAMLVNQQLWDQAAKSQEAHGDYYIEQIIKIQKRWRGILAR